MADKASFIGKVKRFAWFYIVWYVFCKPVQNSSKTELRIINPTHELFSLFLCENRESNYVKSEREKKTTIPKFDDWIWYFVEKIIITSIKYLLFLWLKFFFLQTNNQLNYNKFSNSLYFFFHFNFIVKIGKKTNLFDKKFCNSWMLFGEIFSKNWIIVTTRISEIRPKQVLDIRDNTHLKYIVSKQFLFSFFFYYFNIFWNLNNKEFKFFKIKKEILIQQTVKQVNDLKCENVWTMKRQPSQTFLKPHKYTRTKTPAILCPTVARNHYATMCWSEPWMIWMSMKFFIRVISR